MNQNVFHKRHLLGEDPEVCKSIAPQIIEVQPALGPLSSSEESSKRQTPEHEMNPVGNQRFFRCVFSCFLQLNYYLFHTRNS